MAWLKLALVAFSFIFWAAGLTLLALGLWAQILLSLYLLLSTDRCLQIPYVLLPADGALLLWGFLGCFSAAAEHRGLLCTSAALQLAGLVGRLLALLSYGALTEGLCAGLQEVVWAYGEEAGKVEALDSLQCALGCCGAESYRFWLASTWPLVLPTSPWPICCLPTWDPLRPGTQLFLAPPCSAQPPPCWPQSSLPSQPSLALSSQATVSPAFSLPCPQEPCLEGQIKGLIGGVGPVSTACFLWWEKVGFAKAVGVSCHCSAPGGYSHWWGFNRRLWLSQPHGMALTHFILMTPSHPPGASPLILVQLAAGLRRLFLGASIRNLSPLLCLPCACCFTFPQSYGLQPRGSDQPRSRHVSGQKPQ